MSRGDDKILKQLSRREALAWFAGSAAGAALSRPALAAAASGRSDPSHRWGMAIDLDRCVRCHGCVVACASENNIAPLGRSAAANARPIHWMTMLVPDFRREASELGPAPAPVPCMHCDRPECVKVCPVGATYQTDDGIVAQIWDRCIGCRYCMVACPYGRRSFNWTQPIFPGDNPSSVNPDVAVRPAGVVEKCTLCQHRIQATLEKSRLDEQPLQDEQLQRLPACATACPTHAITFGDLADPTSLVARLAQSPRAVRLLAHLGTGPKVIYLRRTR
jgi:molybdopterin-containing oxidoreductase family iron-sulfur binding subunit